MKKTLSALFIMLASSVVFVNAQEAKTASGKIRCSENSELILPEGMEFAMRDLGAEKRFTPVRKAKAAADGELVTVNFKVTSAYSPDEAWIYNKDLMQAIDFFGKESSVEVPKGTYDLCLGFSDKSYYYVFKENVEVTDGMVIEFDQSESTHPLEFHYFDENNRELHMDVSYQGEVVTPGTADEVIKLSSIIHKDYGHVTLVLSRGYKQKGYLMDFYVNDISDKYFLGETATIGVGTCYYAYKTVVTDFKKGIYNSDPKNLTKLVTDFTLSPAMKDEKELHAPAVEASFLFNGKMIVSNRTWAKTCPEDYSKVITYIDCPETAKTDECQMNMLVRPGVVDAYQIVHNDYYGDSKEFSLLLAPYAIGNATQSVKYLVSGGDKDAGFNIPVGESSHMLYPGHPEFSFATPNGTAQFGTSVPMMSYSSMKTEYSGQFFVVDNPRYLGRFGELRETDHKLAKIKEEKTTNGTLVTVTNDNVEVDGIAGKNVAEILYDLNKEDKTAPTFQMLSFKDADGNICDRFSSTQGAKMLVAGGDFTYVMVDEYPYIGHFTCDAPSSVKAYYAPHGTDAWTELALVEDPDKYFMPAFGHFYEADLSGVKTDGENAWIDLRLEMEDAAGNYQKQLISPAFKVNSTAAIDEISSVNDTFVVMGKTVMLAGGNVADITVCSVDGRALQNTYANGVDLSSMGSGVYIITAVTADGNMVSTKVAF